MNSFMTHFSFLNPNRSELVPRRKGSFFKNGIYSRGNLFVVGKCQVQCQLLLHSPSDDTECDISGHGNACRSFGFLPSANDFLLLTHIPSALALFLCPWALKLRVVQPEMHIPQERI